MNLFEKILIEAKGDDPFIPRKLEDRAAKEKQAMRKEWVAKINKARDIHSKYLKALSILEKYDIGYHKIEFLDYDDESEYSILNLDFAIDSLNSKNKVELKQLQ